jgi:RNA polymerase sigma-70 factor (ECF subfamily)
MSLKVESDENLMRLYLSGDSNAFDELYRRHASKVYSYLIKRTGAKQEADELHQLVFLKFHRTRQNYDPKYPVLQWLFVMSKSIFLDYCRKKKREVFEVTDYSQSEMDQMTMHDPEPQVTTPSLDHLSEEQLQILNWRILDERTFAEIANATNKSEATVRQTLSRILRKLRNQSLAKGSEK